MCLGGLRRSLGATFVKHILKHIMVQKVSGKVQEGPRSPLDPLKNYICFLKIFIFSENVFLKIISHTKIIAEILQAIQKIFIFSKPARKSISLLIATTTIALLSLGIALRKLPPNKEDKEQMSFTSDNMRFINLLAFPNPN